MTVFAGELPSEAYFPRSDEGLHRPGQDGYWQESVALAWGDLDKGVGGFMRIGHTPNINGGEMTLWVHTYTPDWVYGDSRDFPKQLDDFAFDRLKVGDVASYDFDGQDTVWHYDQGEVTFELRSQPFHLPISLWPRVGSSYGRDIGNAHFEVANRVVGTLTVKGNTYEVDGFGHRDHSWGVRYWWKRKSHRWVNGVFGPDLSFCMLTYHGESEKIGRFGYVFRDGEVHHSTDIDILVHMEPDGATHRGGVARITLATGDTLEFTAEPLGKGFYAYRSGSALFESCCRISYEGRAGFGDFEISENARGGHNRPTSLVNAVESGLFPVDGNGDTRPTRRDA
jgi:hypothetical protein